LHGLEFEDVVIRNSFQIKWIGFDKFHRLHHAFLPAGRLLRLFLEPEDLILGACLPNTPDREILGAPEQRVPPLQSELCRSVGRET
jgi:hypothetical protein